MERQKLARLLWKLWKRRNWYKRWYDYERTSNNAWNNHYEQRQRDWEEQRRNRGINP